MLRALLVCALAIGAVAVSAQQFEAPERIMAGKDPAGHELNGRARLYPSPGLHDITGDGELEMVIGDLRGQVTYMTRTKDGWSEEKLLMATDGNPLKFHNW
jgi:hypothetical protein